MNHLQKNFEVSLPKAVYFGVYEIEDNRIVIDEVHTFDEDEQRVEIDSINDKEIYSRIYAEVEKQYSDEILSEEEYKQECLDSIKESYRD